MKRHMVTLVMALLLLGTVGGIGWAPVLCAIGRWHGGLILGLVGVVAGVLYGALEGWACRLVRAG